MYSEYCDFVKGWRINPGVISSGNDLPPNLELKLSKKINIVLDNGYIEFSTRHHHTLEYEKFYLLVNGIRYGKTL
jgi:hypothetical protein